MTTIPATLVRTLRERTQAGMMECKKFLEEAKGDLDLAEELMRKALSLKASKKADRIATEGSVFPLVEGKKATIIEVNCETDFVARGEEFQKFVKMAATTILAGKSIEEPALNEVRQTLVAKLGENIQVRRFELLEAAQGAFASYVHGNKIGVLVHYEGDENLGKDLAMHIAASSPQVVNPEDVNAELIEKEREIYRAQAENSGKPANIIEKMIDGKVQKFLCEISLLKQAFVKNPDITVEAHLKAARGKVFKFIRFEVGEGLEKKVDNFVEEVMSQARRGS